MLRSVIISFSPLIFISHLTGLFIFRVDFKNSKLLTSKWEKVLIFATITFHIVSSDFYLNSEMFKNILVTQTSKISSPFLIRTDHVLCVGSMLWSYVKREEILKIFIKLSEIDEMLGVLGIEIDYKGQQRKLAITLGIFMTNLIATMIIGAAMQMIEISKFDILIPIFNFLVFIIGLALLCNFFMFMWQIGLRFEKLNSCMAYSITELPKIHLKIADCVETYNATFGPIMMLIFGNLLVWSCMTASLAILIDKNENSFAWLLIFNLIVTGLFLIFIIKAAERILCAKHRAIQVLFMKMANGDGHCEKIQQFIMQIWHTNVAFSCKFFEFNWHLMFKFGAAFVMYLIIILQLEDGMRISDSEL